MTAAVGILTYSRVRVAAMAAVLPDEVVSSEQIEARLQPVYDRLNLPAGRLELMTGIGERRFFQPRTKPGAVSARTVRNLLEVSPIAPNRIGALVHGSVCRDQMEPATAAAVHEDAGLSSSCRFFDVSNACLGILDSALLVADMIELGRIDAALVVGTEIGRPLVEGTMDALLTDPNVTRKSFKDDFASLTIGSGSAGFLLVNEDLFPEGCQLHGAAIATDTSATKLCAGGTESTPDDRPRMSTDSEALLHAGVGLASKTWDAFHPELLGGQLPDRVTTHQVGSRHRKLLLDTLGIKESLDYPTVERFGNTGSAALPMAATLGADNGHTSSGDSVAWLGIGSGLTCQMLALTWGKPCVSVSEAA